MAKLDGIFKKMKKSLSEDPTVSATDKKKRNRELDQAGKLFQTLNSKDFDEEFEKNRNNEEIDIIQEIIDITVSLVSTLMKQRKLKKPIDSIHIRIREDEYSFPPTISISSGGEEMELETEVVKPKELHYEFEAVSADFNLTYGDDHTIINQTYQKIIERLEEYDWPKVCQVSENLKVLLK